MYFASWSEFFAMGGHAPFVWASYGIAVLSLGALILGSRLNQRRWLALQRRRRQIAQQHFSVANASKQPQSQIHSATQER